MVACYFIRCITCGYRITVAKGAPPHAPLRPLYGEGNSGPRFDNYGHMIDHSILGSLEDYERMAQIRGGIQAEGETSYQQDEFRVATPTYKYVRGYSRSQRRIKHQLADEQDSNALINWQNKMRERKMQQGYISSKCVRPGRLITNKIL